MATQLDHIEKQLETLTECIGVLGESFDILKGMVGELMVEMSKPPDSDFPKLIKKLASTVEQIHQGMKDLPAAVARAVTTGEVP